MSSLNSRFFAAKVGREARIQTQNRAQMGRFLVVQPSLRQTASHS